MKRLIFLSAMLVFAIASIAQPLMIPKGVKALTHIITPTEISYLHGITGKPISQAEADARYPQIADGDPTPIYTAAEVDNLLVEKAPLNSPAFTGNPTVPTQAEGDNSTKTASTAFVYKNTITTIDCGSQARITHTGTTSETTVKTVAIPAGRIGVNGRLLINAIVDGTTGDGYTKSFAIKVNGTTAYGSSATTNTFVNAEFKIINRNSYNSQIIFGYAANTISLFNINQNVDANTLSKDLSGEITITVTMTLSNASASEYLDHISIVAVY